MCLHIAINLGFIDSENDCTAIAGLLFHFVLYRASPTPLYVFLYIFSFHVVFGVYFSHIFGVPISPLFQKMIPVCQGTFCTAACLFFGTWHKISLTIWEHNRLTVWIFAFHSAFRDVTFPYARSHPDVIDHILPFSGSTKCGFEGYRRCLPGYKHAMLLSDLASRRRLYFFECRRE